MKLELIDVPKRMHKQEGNHKTNRKMMRAQRAPRKDPLEMIEIDGQQFSRWPIAAAMKQWKFNKDKAKRRAKNKKARAQRVADARR